MSDLDNAEIAIMTPEEKRLKNLKPWPKGVSGNSKGRPKGIRNMATLVQQILADEALMEKLSKNKPSYWDSLPGKNAANAIIVAQAIKALEGDTKAAAWVIKTGYGDKVDITSDGERLEMAPVIVSNIVPRIVENAETETETTTDDPADK